MSLVLDASILFAALIKDGFTRRILFVSKLELYAPDFLLEEVMSDIPSLIQQAHSSEKEIKEMLAGILSHANVQMVSPNHVKSFDEMAKEISPDPDDWQYFALALKMNCPLWSNDKKLKEQKFVKVVSTHELMKSISRGYNSLI